MARRRIRKIRKAIFSGREYNIRWGKLAPEKRSKGKAKGVYTVFGECDPPGTTERELKINDKEGKSPEKMDYETFATSFHEGCHATNWNLSEKTIKKLEENVCPFLWRIFFQRKN